MLKFSNQLLIYLKTKIMYLLILFLIILATVWFFIFKTADTDDIPQFCFGSILVGLFFWGMMSVALGRATDSKVIKTTYDLQPIEKNYVISTKDDYILQVKNKIISLSTNDVEVQFVKGKPRLERIETVSRDWIISWGFEMNDKVEYVLYLNL